MPSQEQQEEKNNNFELSEIDVIVSGPVRTDPRAHTSPMASICVLLTPKVLKVIIVVLATAVITGTAVIIVIVVLQITLAMEKAPKTVTVMPSSTAAVLNISSTPSSTSASGAAATTSSTPVNMTLLPETPESLKPSSSTTTTISNVTSYTPPAKPSTASSTVKHSPSPSVTEGSEPPTESSRVTPPNTTSSVSVTTLTFTTSTTTLPTSLLLNTTSTTTQIIKSVIDIDITDCFVNNQFQCASGECIDWTQLCNGLPDCVDGSDEKVGCVCGFDQWRCNSGQCIPVGSRCNKVINCMDSSDEAFCPDCAGFQCDSGLCLWDDHLSKCNGIFDCADLSDEMGCSLRQGPLLCTNGVRLQRDKWCNGIDDCGDNTDETSCQDGCPIGRVACPDGRCIRRSWLCDGYADCDNGTDEASCSKCMPTEFTCNNYLCLNKAEECNGIAKCRFGEDEQRCFSLPDQNMGVLQVQFQGNSLTVCSDVWSADFAVQICAATNYSQAVEWEEVKIQPSLSQEPPQFAAFKLIDGNAVTANLAAKYKCESGLAISITCSQEECGERKVPFLQSFVAGGQVVSPGKWPWVVSLLYLGQSICGGTLISNRWVITAAHCILYGVKGAYDLTLSPHNFEVILGSTHRLGQMHVGTPYRIRTDRIVLFPNLTQEAFNQVVDWDMALVRLVVPVSYSDYIQPACLPHQGQSIPPSTVCYAAGWGKISSLQAQRPEYLRDARMQILNDQICARSVAAGERAINTNSTLCCSYFDGLPTTCQGDSGGPLICQSPSSRWMLAGVTSHGNSQCGTSGGSLLANRFSRIANAANWIRHTIRET